MGNKKTNIIAENTREKLYLTISFDIIEIYKNDKLSREHIYHYKLNNQSFGEKKVDEYTRSNIIRKLYEFGEKIGSSQNDSNSYINEICKIGGIIFNLILSNEIRDVLFDTNNHGKYLIIDNMDNLLPLELAYNGNIFLSLIYKIGRAVPTYHSTSSSINNSTDLNIFLLSDPKSDLSNAKNEVSALVKNLSILKNKKNKNIKVNSFTGSEVTKELVLFDILLNGKCDILHFCGHCCFDNETPSQSCLVLSDGQLKAFEIENMKGNPIIFNNSCSSALDGEEKTFFGRGNIEGLASNFVKYGAIAYIGCLWPIEDHVAMNISNIFYKNLIQKEYSIGESLRIAKKEVFANNPDLICSCLSYVFFGDPAFSLYKINKDDLNRTTFYNEKAIYEVMRFEREYCGLEMLTINDHHWIFWKKKTLEKWIRNITPAEKEREQLLMEFDNYQRHFRKLAINGKKCFKIILNYKTFKKYLEKIDVTEANDIIIDTIKFLELSNFNLIFYSGDEDEIEEYEIVSKNKDENQNIKDNLCVVIKQSRIDKDCLYYFLYFNDTKDLIIDHINRYNNYKNLCLEQYKKMYSQIFPNLRDIDITKIENNDIKKVTTHILEDLLKLINGICEKPKR